MMHYLFKVDVLYLFSRVNKIVWQYLSSFFRWAFDGAITKVGAKGSLQPALESYQILYISSFKEICYAVNMCETFYITQHHLSE